MGPSDRDLLLAIHRGHEAPARLLWARHGSRLLAHARSILRDPSAAEDAVQTVLCRLLQVPRGRLEAIEDVPAFLAAATRREAINHLRSQRREADRRAAAGAPRPDAGAAPVLGGALGDALDALPRRFREVLVLKHAAGLTFDQMARAMDTNRSTIAGRYRAAISALKRQLRPDPCDQGAAR